MPEKTAATKATAAKKEAPKGDTLTVTLRDEADSTVDSVSKLIVHLGGSVSKVSGDSLTVAPPPESERNTGDRRQKLVDGLRNDALVVEVE